MPPNVEASNLSLPCDENKSAQCRDTIHDRSSDDEWVCPASTKSLRTRNPIRAIVDPIVANSVKCGKERGDGKDQISLALGDPSAYPNLPPLLPLIESASKSAVDPISRGYVNACGSPSARSAIAAFHSSPEYKISPEDVIIANGCSGALELALTAILDENTCVLVPRPGFPLYQVIAESHGGYVRHYNLDEGKGWECDLEDMERLIIEEGEKVRGIVINNPSNPCGSVFSRRHLQDICELAEKYRIVIVSDEVYGDITFGEDNEFHPIGEVANGKTPVITATGLGKQFLVPGWRLGWLLLKDCDGKAKPLKHVKQGIQNLAQVILGASHLAQNAITTILSPGSPELETQITSWRKNLNHLLEEQSNVTYNNLSTCHGLMPIRSNGAMYTMVKIHLDLFQNIQDDLQFTKMLLEEENVFCLPGTCFGSPGFFRVVYCAPQEVLEEAFARVANFCRLHALYQNN